VVASEGEGSQRLGLPNTVILFIVLRLFSFFHLVQLADPLLFCFLRSLPSLWPSGGRLLQSDLGGGSYGGREEFVGGVEHGCVGHERRQLRGNHHGQQAPLVPQRLRLHLRSVISKLSMIPVVCVMEWILHGKQYSKEVKMAVVVVVVGVGVCTVTDVKVNAKGFFCASAAVVSSSFQQIVSFYSQVLPSSLFPIPSSSVGQRAKPKEYLTLVAMQVFILLSCLLAVFCNISQYLCIGRFSAVSFQVLGHMKTVCVLTLGWLLFDSELTLNNIMGMAIAVIGMVVYSWAVELEKQANKAKFLSKTSLTEEDIRLLKDAVETASVKDVELGETKA
ncbi:hypothetical protein GW17_00037593, partial [Ensete ventricosum]